MAALLAKGLKISFKEAACAVSDQREIGINYELVEHVGVVLGLAIDKPNFLNEK